MSPADPSTKDLKQQAGVVRDDVTELTQIAREVVRNELSRLGHATTDAVDRGKTRLTEFGEESQERVRERPMTSLAIAAGAGLLLGMLLKSRS